MLAMAPLAPPAPIGCGPTAPLDPIGYGPAGPGALAARTSSDTERLCTPSPSVQETPSRGVMLTPLKDRLQKDLDKLMKKTHVNLRRFSTHVALTIDLQDYDWKNGNHKCIETRQTNRKKLNTQQVVQEPFSTAHA
ncbi:hypothetical protein TURU_020608 [Turdus rufiventris]|nr:hypothetical protein TURU_020608 [Turdus rufiventris]